MGFFLLLDRNTRSYTGTCTYIYVFKMVLTMTFLSLLVIVRIVVSFLLKKIIVI